MSEISQSQGKSDEKSLELMLQIRERLNRLSFKKVTFDLEGKIIIEDPTLTMLFLRLGLETDGFQLLKTDGPVEFCNDDTCDPTHGNCTPPAE